MSNTMKSDNPWKNAKNFKILGYNIPVLKDNQDGDRKFYTELYRCDSS